MIYVVSREYESDDGLYTAIEPKLASISKNKAELIAIALGRGWTVTGIPLIDADWTTEPKHATSAYVTPINRNGGE